MDKSQIKKEFSKQLKSFAKDLKIHVSTEDNQWTIKGFIDIFKNVYSISNDTKIISKILEIHLFPKFLEFAGSNNYHLVFAEKQNWYPDISLVSNENPEIKFAVDLKTTYRLPDYDGFCNGFTLGSHGEYFKKRTSEKNIQFPYQSYLGHFCLGIIYDRNDVISIDETKIYSLSDIEKITSVISNFIFFASEKWKISSDKRGSGNTANIGSIDFIEDILNENGVFKKLGEDVFDDYWMNYGQIQVARKNKNGTKQLTSLPEYLEYRGMNSDLMNKRKPKRKNKK